MTNESPVRHAVRHERESVTNEPKPLEIAGIDVTNERDERRQLLLREDLALLATEERSKSKSPEGNENVARDEVSAVFALWCEVTKRRSTTKLDSKRRKAIERALKDYPLDDVLDAIRGLGASDWHMSRGGSATQLTLVLRDSDHIEGFRDRWLEASSGGAAATPRPTRGSGPRGTFTPADLLQMAREGRRHG